MTGKKTLSELLSEGDTQHATPNPFTARPPLRPSGATETVRGAAITTPTARTTAGRAQASVTAKIAGFGALAGGSAPADGFSSTPGGAGMDTGYQGTTDMVDVDAVTSKQEPASDEGDE